MRSRVPGPGSPVVPRAGPGRAGAGRGWRCAGRGAASAGHTAAGSPVAGRAAQVQRALRGELRPAGPSGRSEGKAGAAQGS